VKLGVRPEDLTVVEQTGDVDPSRQMEATVRVLEPMGSDNFLSLDLGLGDEKEWVARVDSAYIPDEHSTISVTFTHGAMNLFADDGTTIKSQGEDSEAFHGAEIPASH
jgi:multiple sugar transport system ATP-binding protein